MKIDSTHLMNQEALKKLNQKGNQSNKSQGDAFGNMVSGKSEDTYQTTGNFQASYSYHTNININATVIEFLTKEGEDVFNSVRDLVMDLLERQGYSIDQLNKEDTAEIDVDEIAREKAKEMIGPGGVLSPEKVSDRIVNFAISVFGGDKSKIDIIRNSIDRGFAEAEKILGQLADVSNTTYDMIQEKLDNWLAESEKSVSEEAEPSENQ